MPFSGKVPTYGDPIALRVTTHPKTKVIFEGCLLGLQFAPLQVVPS